MTPSDQRHAEYVRNKLVELRSAIADAKEAGLSVEVPELLHLYLGEGCASGAPADWKITRRF